MYITGEQIHARVKKIAKSRGLTMKELAQKLDLSENGIKYGLIKKTIKLDTLLRMAMVLNIDYKKIVEGDDNNYLQEDIPAYGNTDLRVALEECRKEKERAWNMVEWLQSKMDNGDKKERVS